jgi:hypothetical protein
VTPARLEHLPSPAPEHPVTLALLRVAVCALVLLSPEVRNAPAAAAFPEALRVAPEGLGWFVAHVPIGPGIARIAQLGLALGAVAGLAGYRSRLALGMVAFFGFYLFGLAQLQGAVVHDMHLVWFAAILAVSPCGDTLSLFQTAKKERAVAYAWPLVMVRALFATIYFFPGLWKLRESGLAWALSDNLRNQMYAKWFEYAAAPPFIRIDEHPLLLRGSALGVLAFEIGFPLLMLSRRTRIVAAIGGIAFHLAGYAFLRISFPSLWLCYVALVDWGPLADRLDRAGTTAASSLTASASAAGEAWPRLVGGVILAAAVVQGFRGEMFAWPFACYPRRSSRTVMSCSSTVAARGVAARRSAGARSGRSGDSRTDRHRGPRSRPTGMPMPPAARVARASAAHYA